MVQRSCTKTNNDVRKQGGGDDEQSPYLKIPHTSEEKRRRKCLRPSPPFLACYFISRTLHEISSVAPFSLPAAQNSPPHTSLSPPSLCSRCLSSRASHHLLSCFSSQQHGFLHQQHGVSCSWSHAWREVPPTPLGCCQLL